MQTRGRRGLPLKSGSLYAVAAAVAFPLEPRAPVRLADEPKLALRLSVLLGGAVALAVAGQRWLAVALAAAVICDELALVAVRRPIASAD